MKKKEKLLYESPSIEVIDVYPEGVICLTGDGTEEIGDYDGPGYSDDDFE